MKPKIKNELHPIDFTLRVENGRGRLPDQGRTPAGALSAVTRSLDAVRAIREEYPEAQIHVELVL